MKIKIWVLSTCVPGDTEPCWPQVFSSEEAAQAGFLTAMRGEWECNPGCDDDGNPLPFPDDPNEAHDLMSQNEEWGRWELTSHEIDLPADIAGLASERAAQLDAINDPRLQRGRP